MLQTFRDHSGSLFIKILFGVLVASFALWGVGDVFRDYTTMRPVATIGKSSVSQEEFLQTYQRVINNFQVMSKGKISIEEIKKMNIYQRVLDDLIDVKVIKETINDFGLIATDDAVRNHIQSAPAFKNEKGQFDKSKFDLLISNNGLTETGFIKEMRETLLQQQLFGTFDQGVTLPAFYEDKIFQELHQERVFTVVHLPLSQMEISGTPTDVELEKIYKENQAEFTSPEYRKISFFIIDPKAVRDRIKIDETQLRQAYESRKGTFTLPETRDVTQLIFTSKENAQNAVKALAEGQNTHDVAKKYQGELRQIDQATPDKFVQNQSASIFSLTAGSVSEVLDSALGYTIFMVTKIVPERVQDFDEVRSKLEDDLKVDQSNDELYALKNKIDDALASGANIGDVAKEHTLSIQVVEMIDKNGVDAAAKSVLPVDYKNLILENAFLLAEGAESSILEAANGTAVVIRVDKIIPQALPEFKQIKEKVMAVWQETKRQEKAAEMAQQIVKEANSVEKLTTLAKQKGLTIKVLKPVNRVDMQKQQEPLDGVSVNIIRQGFVLESHKAAYGPIPEGFAVIMLDKTVPFDISKEKDKRTSFDESVKKMLQQDLRSGYTKYLRHHDKVSINDEILHRLINHS